MKKHILFSLAVIFLSVIGCTKPEEGGKDNPQPPAPHQEQITIPSTVDVTPVVPPEGGDAKIMFTAATAWTASVINTKADSWVDVNPKSGNPGPAEIKITTTPNDTYVERNATIQIKCGGQTKDVVLTQKQVDNITVTTDKVELGAEGGTFTIEIKSNIDFSYEIEGDWIKYVSTKAYTDTTLSFTAEPNDGIQKREGSVTVKGGEFSETVKVYQSGEEPTLVISQNECNLEAEGGSIAVEVSSNVAVTMTIPEGAGWITENSTKSVSTSTFHLDVAANETKEARSAEITFSNEESGLSEKVTVNQEGNTKTPVPEMVDLGLSVKWASFNVGATKPEEYGGYYTWAGLEDVTSTSIYLEWDNCPYYFSYGFTKYVPSDDPSSWTGSGSPDNKSVIEPEDDVAHMTLGGKWRIPTDAEWGELINSCTWTWTQLNGVNGYRVTSNKSGYADKWIFLPAAGYRDGYDLNNVSSNGSYWSSSLYLRYPTRTYELGFSSGGVHIYDSGLRYEGCSVRPVYDDKAGETETVNFPDEVFRNYMIQNFDLDNDGTISLDEASKVEMIYIETTDIESLSGIEYCPELKVLGCCGFSKEHGKLKEVDVSKNPKLISLVLDDNSLESLDISRNVNIQGVGCRNNNISSINISDNADLSFLDISGNSISTLNLSNCKKLNSLYATGNELKTLDLSENQVLEWIEVSDNKLENLVLPSSVVILKCMNNHLKTVDFSNTPELYEMVINNTDVIDLSHCTELENLYCNDVKNVNISNTNLTYEYGFSEISGANSITAKNCKNLEFTVNTSSCVVDTDVPTVKVFVYDQIETSIKFGDSKVDKINLETYRNEGDGEKSYGLTRVESKNVSFIDVLDPTYPCVLSFCYGSEDRYDAVPNLKRINFYSAPTEIRLSKKDLSGMINIYSELKKTVYIAKSKLTDFGPYVPITSGYTWKYVESVPIIVNTYTKSIFSPEILTTGARETNWTPQKDGYEWHPITIVDFEFN